MADSAKRDCESYRIEFVRAAPKLHGKELLMSAQENVRVMRQIFSAIEQRDAQRMLDLCDPYHRISLATIAPLRGSNVWPRSGGSLMGQDVVLSATDRGRATDGSTCGRHER
jgi:hypothetical protein